MHVKIYTNNIKNIFFFRRLKSAASENCNPKRLLSIAADFSQRINKIFKIDTLLIFAFPAD